LFIQRKKAYFLLTEENKKILLQIGALHAANSTLNSNSEKLKEFNKTKDRFFSIISHDLKGPLNSLHGPSAILMKYADSFSKTELKDFGRNMDKSVHNLLDLLQNLFQWSQTQNGMLEYRPQSIHYAKMVQKTVNILNVTADSKEIE
jgi:K+-sensing histidine kinase KdpD